MPKALPARELRERAPDSGQDRYAATYKVYTYGRLRGAIIPVPDAPENERWKALDLDGGTTFWKYRNQARDYLCTLPPRGTAKDAGAGARPAR
jgi:hypothetical protein